MKKRIVAVKNLFVRFKRSKLGINPAVFFIAFVGLIIGSYLILRTGSKILALNDTIQTWPFDAASSVNYTYDSSLITVDNGGARPNPNKFTNPDFGSDNSSWNLSAVAGSTTPNNWTIVPGDSTYSTGDFLAMKYEAKCASIADPNTGLTSPDSGYHTYYDSDTPCTSADGDEVVSTASGYPITYISQTDSAARCSNVNVSGYTAHLITDNEWQTIARNAEATPANWSAGLVGEGYLYAGHNDASPAFALPASTTDTGDYACAYTDSSPDMHRDGTYWCSNAGSTYEQTPSTVNNWPQCLAWCDSVMDASHPICEYDGPEESDTTNCWVKDAPVGGADSCDWQPFYPKGAWWTGLQPDPSPAPPGITEAPSPCPTYTASGQSGAVGNQKRVFILSNGAYIWDIAGNVWEWVDGTIEGQDEPAGATPGFGWKEFTDLVSYGTLGYDLVAPAGSYNSTEGMGKIDSSGQSGNTTVYGFIRGGYWVTAATNFTGAFAWLMSLPPDTNNTYGIGFRCATDPVVTQTYLPGTGHAENGSDSIAVGSVSDAKLVQDVNVGDTSNYDISAYVYNSGNTVDDTVAQLYYNGAIVSTIYTDAGSGWWKLSGTITGVASSVEAGLLIYSGNTVTVDDFTLDKSGTYSIYTTLAYSNAQVSSWDSFCQGTITGTCSGDGVTATGSASVTYQLCTDDGSTCETDGSWQYWNGSAWAAATDTTTTVNTADELTQAAMQALPVTSQKISVKAIMQFGGADYPVINNLSVGMTTTASSPTPTPTPGPLTCSDGPSYTFDSPDNFTVATGSAIANSQLTEQISANDSPESTNAETNQEFTGDFQVDTHVTDLSTTPTTAVNNAAQLELWDGTLGKYIIVEATTDENASHSAILAFSDGPSSSNPTWTAIGSIDNIPQVSDVWLRLVRSQGTISGYVKTDTNGDFQLIGTSMTPLLANSSAPVYIDNQLTSNQSSTDSSVTFESFLISCLQTLTASCSSDNTNVTLSWNSMTEAAYYLLRVDDTDNNTPSCTDDWYCSDPPDTMSGDLNTTSETVDVTTGANYKAWVQYSGDNNNISSPAYVYFNCNGTNGGSSSNSQSSNNTVDSGLPPSCYQTTPTTAPNLEQITVSGTSATLYFTQVYPADQYQVFYGYTAGDTRFGATFPGYGPVTINDLNPHTTYYFAVRGEDVCAAGPFSNWMSVRSGAGTGSGGSGSSTTTTSGTSSNSLASAQTSSGTTAQTTPLPIPVTGTSWPTFFGFGLGVATIIGSVLLIL
jgi:formylglycine-generating enzyme required for sulfatase activity